MRGHLLKCWQRVLALCMSTPALPRVGRGQPEPESVVRPQRWDGAGSLLFTGVPTRNSWRVQSNPLKMLLSLLQPAANPRSCSAEVTNHIFYYCLPETVKMCRLQPHSGTAPAAPWAGPGTDSWEETRDRRNLGKRGGYRWWGMKELDLVFLKLAPLSSFPKHGPLAPSSIAYCEKRHMENDTPLRARLFSLGIWWFFENSLK